jgi:hypothetical protein
MTTARAINESLWCGCADGRYVIELVEAVEKCYDDYASQQPDSPLRD